MSSLQLSLPHLAASRFKHRPVCCANERHDLFNRIAPVYDNSASNMKTHGRILEWGKNGRLRLGFVLWKRGFNVPIVRESWFLRKNGLKVMHLICRFVMVTLMLLLWVMVVDKYRAMQEMFRVLKPGSRVSVLDFNKSMQPFTALFQEWMIDNVVVPTATVYGLVTEYKYLKTSIDEFLTGKELEKLALDAGFSYARHYEIGGSLMGNLVATCCMKIHALSFLTMFNFVC